MTTQKTISQLTELTAAGATDELAVVDKSGQSGVTKRITVDNAFKSVPAGQVSAPGLAFAADVDTGITRIGADQLALCTGGQARLTVGSTGDITIGSNLIVDGTTTSISSETLVVEDRNIELGTVASPSDATANGGGITLKGATDKTIQWVQSTGAWTFNQPTNFNDHVRIDSSGRLGIGNTAMSSFTGNASDNLVVGSGSGSEGITVYSAVQGSITFADGTSGDAAYRGAVEYSHTADKMSFRTAGTGNRMVIDSAGNVGIATANPSRALTIAGSMNLSSGQRIESSSSGGNLVIQGGSTYPGGHIKLYGGSGSDKIEFCTTGASDTNVDVRMVIDSSGRLLVGGTSITENDHANIDANGTLTIRRSSGGAVYVNKEAATRLYISADGGVNSFNNALGFISYDATFEATSYRYAQFVATSSEAQVVAGAVGSLDTPLVFKTSNSGTEAEAMRIDSSGRLLVGGTASSLTLTGGVESQNAGVVGTSATLDLQSGAPGFMSRLSGNNNADQVVGVWFNHGGLNAGIGCSRKVTNQWGTDLRFYTHKSQVADQHEVYERMRIDSEGNVGIGTSSPTDKLSIHTAPNSLVIGAKDTTRENHVFQLLANNTAGDGEFRLYKNAASGTHGKTVEIKSTGVSYFNGGNVGIGDTNPDRKLQVINSTDALMRLGRSDASSHGSTDVEIKFSKNYYSNAVFEAASHRFEIQGTEKVRIDSDGNVAIGTTSANSERLNIMGPGHDGQGTTNTRSVISYNLTSSNVMGLWFGARTDETTGIIGSRTATGNIGFETYNGGWGERMRITSSGNVGIGTNAPSHPLEVRGVNTQINFAATSTGGGYLMSTGAGQWSISGGVRYNGAGWYARHTSSSMIRDDGDANMRFFTNTGNTVNAYIAPAERMRIDSSGRLLHGLTSSSSTSSIVVQGNSAGSTGQGIVYIAKGTATPSSGDQLGAIAFSDSTHNGSGQIQAQRDGGTWSSSSKPTRLIFFTTADGESSPTGRMRIGSAGSLRTFSSSTGVDFCVSASPGTTSALIVGRNSATAIATGTSAFVVWSNGNVQNTNNSYGSISDIKLKENIVNANSQWDDLKALQVRNYNFKEGQTHTQIGLVAQEAELVSPGLVFESPDRDEEGNDLGTTTKSVNYSVLYMKAVKALQEAMERIETLEQRLSDAGIA